MIGLDKCKGSCNVLFPKICFPKKEKDINVPVYNVIRNKNETLIGEKLLHIRFNRIDTFVRIYDRTRYLGLFGSEKYDAI